MTYRIAGIDVHKKMLAVVVTDTAREGEMQFERGQFATGEGLRLLIEGWKRCRGGGSSWNPPRNTGKPVWQALEPRFGLELAQPAIQLRAARTQVGFP